MTKWFDDKRNQQLVKGIVGLVAFALVTVLIFIFAGKPILDWVKQPETFRAWISERGWLGRFAFIGMMALQVIVAIIPGEPLEIAAGYAFGVVEGSILCMLGILLGSCIVFWFVRTLGVKVVELFFHRDRINEIGFLKNERSRDLLIFIVFLIPGTPKDILTYCAGLTKIKFGTWVLISTIARIPSILTSTIGGDALGLKNYQFAIVVFAITLVISAIGILVYKRMNRKEAS